MSLKYAPMFVVAGGLMLGVMGCSIDSSDNSGWYTGEDIDQPLLDVEDVGEPDAVEDEEVQSGAPDTADATGLDWSRLAWCAPKAKSPVLRSGAGSYSAFFVVSESA